MTRSSPNCCEPRRTASSTSSSVCASRPAQALLHRERLLSGGAVLHLHHKLYLPTYAMFDESRYFARGNSVRAFDTRFGRLGMLICEDFWHVSPAYLLWLDGADILILNSSSHPRSQRERSRPVHALGRDGQSSLRQHVHVLHPALHRVGYEDGKNFWGGSSVSIPTASS